ncbi:dephospho-CoA kinase [Fusobacterium mortiferum]|jgi:dephospho-CoA kinase|uniref:Dephospho-CoA kinase n=2 Tax=Fusobacterium mortiferum TaxID=850 RepID=A0A414PMM7_FUSMR|nr:dephospho-CoA kinase [Fusobacterium mortiferum]MDD7262071.1 dephospho-CoA kinase [Fusobacterium mortiferum]MDY4800752.1 dephospho-CoA kinase [Fusobacterium mortiferum]MDY5980465.1 dephospho-CoA kinase [Fusobacterium mortiferum]RGM94879.1 dephospho-CoA kinase [Fusobacterium mortiferum]RHF69829.1 dephospho-CoA kinase [Fusobacterium mortiferum]
MIVGLTGGIASGKSTVSNLFRKYGIEIVDADKVAKEVSEKKESIEKISNIFGKDILDSDGKIVREKLREKAFKNRELLQELNKIIHPQVMEYFKRKKEENSKDEILIFDIPLLYETKMEYLCDKIIVVGVDVQKQIRRVVARDGSSEELAKKIIFNQMPLDEKIKKADIVIMNDGTLDELEAKVMKIYRELKER